jgi:hypothetical protein
MLFSAATQPVDSAKDLAVLLDLAVRRQQASQPGSAQPALVHPTASFCAFLGASPSAAPIKDLLFQLFHPTSIPNLH